MAKDTLYISDIPEEYHFADFNDWYVDLYNQPSARNETLTYYRIYYNCSPGTYVTGTRTFGSYNTTYFDDYPVSGEVWYRPDLDGILTCVFIIAFFGAFLINLITSIVKKDGLLGRLL